MSLRSLIWQANSRHSSACDRKYSALSTTALRFGVVVAWPGRIVARAQPLARLDAVPVRPGCSGHFLPFATPRPKFGSRHKGKTVLAQNGRPPGPLRRTVRNPRALRPLSSKGFGP
jgi:hypothetical protein